jgi:GNAT superfamily N-acetyltransferase
MRLEGIEVFDGCFLRQIEFMPGEDLPLMLIAQLFHGECRAYYGEFIPPGLQQVLTANIPIIQFPAMEPLQDILTKYGIQFEVGRYKTYMFSSIPIQAMDVLRVSKHSSDIKAFSFDGFAEDVFAIQHKGMIVSACVSVRENEKCGEAWVYTAPEYRHQGFAQKVVNAWAGSLMSAGKVPFYSHKIENIASANLARKLRLQPVFEEIAVTQIVRT